MRNINYSPQPIRYKYFIPVYNNPNQLSMTPVINIYNQKFQRNGSSPEILQLQNLPNNNYNQIINNSNNNTPYLIKNNSTSFINNNNIQRINLYQLYNRTNSPTANNSHQNINYNTLYNNRNNSLYSIIKKTDTNQNILYSPTRVEKSNQDPIKKIKINKTNENLFYNTIINQNINQYNTEKK